MTLEGPNINPIAASIFIPEARPLHSEQSQATQMANAMLVGGNNHMAPVISQPGSNSQTVGEQQGRASSGTGGIGSSSSRSLDMVFERGVERGAAIPASAYKTAIKLCFLAGLVLSISLLTAILLPLLPLILVLKKIASIANRNSDIERYFIRLFTTIANKFNLPSLLAQLRPLVEASSRNRRNQSPSIRGSSNSFSNLAFAPFPPRRRALQVERSQISSEPKQLLLRLMKEGWKPGFGFPFVQFTRQNRNEEGMDAGGLRRELVAELCRNAFGKAATTESSESPPSPPLPSGNEAEATEPPAQLEASSVDQAASAPSSPQHPPHSYLSTDKDQFPIMDDHPDTATAYQALGQLWALCYSDPLSKMKIGNIFPVDVSIALYTCITQSGQQNPTSDQWFLENSLRLKLKPIDHAVFLKLIDPSQPAPKLTPEQLATANLYVEAESPAEFKKPEIRQKLYEVLLAEAKADKRLQALSLIADSMKSNLDRATWDKICQSGAMTMKNDLEGELTPELFVSKLKLFECSQNPKNIGILNLLKEWINQEETSKEDLAGLAQAITGRPVLGGEEIKVKVVPSQRNSALPVDPNSIPVPVTHTCFMQIDIEDDMKTLATLDAKLRILIREGVASGFLLG